MTVRKPIRYREHDARLTTGTGLLRSGLGSRYTLRRTTRSP